MKPELIVISWLLFTLSFYASLFLDAFTTIVLWLLGTAISIGTLLWEDKRRG